MTAHIAVSPLGCHHEPQPAARQVSAPNEPSKWLPKGTVARLPCGLLTISLSTVHKGMLSSCHSAQTPAMIPPSIPPQVYSTVPGRPFPLILASIWLTSQESQQTQQQVSWLPFEFTPLYSGCPSYWPNTTPPVGDGFVEELGECVS